MYIDAYKDALAQLCEQNHVKSLYILGAFLVEQSPGDTKISLIVEINAEELSEYTEYYFRLKFALENLFDRPVDLLEDKTAGNKYLQHEIDKTIQLLYEKE